MPLCSTCTGQAEVVTSGGHQRVPTGPLGSGDTCSRCRGPMPYGRRPDMREAYREVFV